MTGRERDRLFGRAFIVSFVIALLSMFVGTFVPFLAHIALALSALSVIISLCGLINSIFSKDL
jgi:hypothetical protein